MRDSEQVEGSGDKAVESLMPGKSKAKIIRTLLRERDAAKDDADQLRADLAEATERHRQYADGIASALAPIREWRHTGEPVRSDREEIAALVSEVAAFESCNRARAAAEEELVKLKCTHSDTADMYSKARAREKRLRDTLENVAKWRERCWAYDDDMGYKRRDFSHDEEWELVEKAASRALAETLVEKG